MASCRISIKLSIKIVACVKSGMVYIYAWINYVDGFDIWNVTVSVAEH